MRTRGGTVRVAKYASGVVNCSLARPRRVFVPESLVPINRHQEYRLLKAYFLSTVKSYSKSQPSLNPG